MAAITQAAFPAYSATNNYSGAHTAVKSSGRVMNTEQHDAALAQERAGRFGLTQFGLVKLPREVLFLQNEMETRVKATRQGDQIQKSKETDSDNDRTLKSVEDGAEGTTGSSGASALDEENDTHNSDYQRDDSKNSSFSPAAAPEESMGKNAEKSFTSSTVGSPSTIYRTLQSASTGSTLGSQLNTAA